METKKLYTLCLIHNPPQVLLGMKKVRWGKGKWNGFGGKVEPGEEVETAMVREVKEEVGLEISNIRKAGVLTFVYPDDAGIMETHIFEAKGFAGEPVESEEMTPKWFDTATLPFENMWPDDKYWFPLFLEGKPFVGRFLFDDKHEIVSWTLTEEGGT